MQHVNSVHVHQRRGKDIDMTPSQMQKQRLILSPAIKLFRLTCAFEKKYPRQLEVCTKTHKDTRQLLCHGRRRTVKHPKSE
jgi:hypothetical protein